MNFTSSIIFIYLPREKKITKLSTSSYSYWMYDVFHKQTAHSTMFLFFFSRFAVSFSFSLAYCPVEVQVILFLLFFDGIYTQQKHGMCVYTHISSLLLFCMTTVAFAILSYHTRCIIHLSSVLIGLALDSTPNDICFHR